VEWVTGPASAIKYFFPRWFRSRLEYWHNEELKPFEEADTIDYNKRNDKYTVVR
jgi:hypothetical protein